MVRDEDGVRRSLHDGRPLRLRRSAVGVLVALGACSLGLAGSASAEGAPSFYAVASADGVRYGTAAPGFLVVEQFADVGTPSAQSLASTTDSSAYAALPYPGSAVFAGLDLGAGAGDKYPLAAISDSAHPEADASTGPVVLKAKSGPDAASAQARGTAAGGPASLGRAEAVASSLHDAKGTATAKAETHVESFSLGVLRIGAVDSVASVVAPDGGKRVRHSDLEVGGVTVAGQAVGVTEKGLVVAGTEVPLPDDVGVGKLLADQQIDVSVVAAQQTPDGVVSAGLRVTQVREVPSLPEPVEVSYLFGRATVGASGGAADAAAAAPAAGPAGAVAAPAGAQPDAGAAPADAPAAAPAEGTTAPEGLDSSDAAVPADAPAAAAATSDAAPVPQTADAAPPGELVQAGAVREALTLDPAVFYLALVLGGVLLLGGTQLIRFFGVKVVWS